MTKISVLVPIFNVEKYLEECLDSIISQTFTDLEIICINDGSTDNSLAIIKRYAKKDPRIVIINKKNSGYGDSMNRGLAKATGEYIGIVESDDWIEPTMFAELYSSAAENDADVVKANFFNYYTNPQYKHLDGVIEHVVNKNETDQVIDTTETPTIFWQQPSIWSAIYKADFLKKNKIGFLPSPGASYQDVGFNFKVWVNAHRVVFREEAYLHYRKDNDNSSINNPGKVFCVSDEYQDVEAYLRKNNLFETFKDIMYSTRWGGYRWNIDRLSPALAKDFIEHASKEYNAALSSGDFIFAYCDVNDSRQIDELIKHPDIVSARKQAAANAKVSVIVPVYNVQNYIRRCLDSITGQSLSDIEIIVVDDGSTDQSAEILEEYYKSDPRFSLINTHNGGLSFARNNGLQAAHADFVMFCDSDDYYNSDSVERMYNAITESDASLAVGGVQMVYENDGLTAHQKNSDIQYYKPKFHGKNTISDALLKKTDVAAWNKIYRKTIIDENNLTFPEGIWYEDSYFFHAYAWSSESIFFLSYDQPIYNYVRRSGSIMSETFNKTPKAYDHLEIAFRLFNFLVQRDIFTKHSAYFNGLFKELHALTVQYLPSTSYPFAADRLSQFMDTNSAFIEKNDPELLAILKIALQDYSPSEDNRALPLQHRVKHLAKSSLKKMYKLTPAYRTKQQLSSEIDSINRRLDQIEKQQQVIADLLSTTIKKLK